jgi:uncharacterized SAM-binding protein YcdF (DUF218 family)
VILGTTARRRLAWAAALAALAWGGLASGLAVWGVGAAPAPDARFDAVVVLGCRTLPDGTPSLCLRRRTDLGVALYNAGAAPRLATTGGVGEGPVAEGEAAALRAVEHGVDRAQITVEGTSTSTWENAVELAALLDAERLLLVTDQTHAWRAGCVFGAFYPHVEVATVSRPGLAVVPMALREALAVVKYAWDGRLGPCLGG